MNPDAWLARLELNLRHPAVREDLGDADKLHKRMMTLISDGLGEQARRQAGLLFRLDESQYQVTALVQSRLPLEPARLPTGYAQARVRDLAPMFAALDKNQHVSYRITANASKRQRHKDHPAAKSGRIVPLNGAAAEQWWRERAARAGLAALTVISSPAGKASSGPLRHDLTRFDGLALVEDPRLLSAAVLEGIGRGKSYGAGLLSLAPARLA